MDLFNRKTKYIIVFKEGASLLEDGELRSSTKSVPRIINELHNEFDPNKFIVFFESGYIYDLFLKSAIGVASNIARENQYKNGQIKKFIKERESKHDKS